MASASKLIQIQILFPENKEKKVKLEVELDAPIQDLMESLNDYFSLPETETIILYKEAERDPKERISRLQTGAQLEWKNGDTVYAFVEDANLKVTFEHLNTKKVVTLEVNKDMKFSELRMTASQQLGIGQDELVACENQRDNKEITDEVLASSLKPGDKISIRSVALSGAAQI